MGVLTARQGPAAGGPLCLGPSDLPPWSVGTGRKNAAGVAGLAGRASWACPAAASTLTSPGAPSRPSVPAPFRLCGRDRGSPGPRMLPQGIGREAGTPRGAPGWGC